VKLDNSSLFVNTGRKPLSAMQRRKKNTRNYIFGVIVLTVIAVLCIFVGLILHVWLNYDATSSDPENPAVVSEVKNEESAETKEPAKEEKSKVTEEKKEDEAKKEEKTEKEKTEKKKTSKSKYKTSGEETEYSRAVQEAFSDFKGTYAYGYVMLNDNSSYIDNVDKIKNSAATSAFLTEYICAKIYTGEFDYSTSVGDYTGEQLINNLITNGSYDAAKTLINYFTPAKINAYLQEKGYENTHFGGEGEDSYTTVEDVAKLMSKFANNTTFFPYSDLYNRMKKSNVRNKIRAGLPEGTSAPNISIVTEGEMIDAAVVYTPNGNYIFVCMANDYKDDGTAANTAMAEGAASMYNLINK